MHVASMECSDPLGFPWFHRRSEDQLVGREGSLGSAVCVDKRDGSQSKPVKSCHGELHAVTVAMLPCSMAQRQREVACF